VPSKDPKRQNREPASSNSPKRESADGKNEVVGGVPQGSTAKGTGAFKLSEIDDLVAKSRALRAERKRATQELPNFVRKRKSVARAPSFVELGWNPGSSTNSSDMLALDIGTDTLCLTRYHQDHKKAEIVIHPTAVIVEDSHAFRSLESFSLEFGPKALGAWPADRVLRGTDGVLLIDSQIGLVEFPVDHALAGIVAKARATFKKEERQLVLTLPTFLPQTRRKAIRDHVASIRRGAFTGVPSAISSAYFYLRPGLSDEQSAMAQWARLVLGDQHLLILDWGASGLEFGLVEHKQTEKTLHLSLSHAGTWPSLGGHSLTLQIFRELKELIIDALLEAGPSHALIRRALYNPKKFGVPRPIEYEEAFERLQHWGPMLSKDEEKECRRLKNILFPTAWRFEKDEEPKAYAPYRRMAILHFRSLWRAAERIKRLLLSKPNHHRAQGYVTWHVHELDSPFLQSLDVQSLQIPAVPFLDKVQIELGNFLMHLDKVLRTKNVRGLVNMAFCGMQSGSELLRGVSDGLSARLAPYSRRPSELKSVVNRGATLLHRDWKTVDFTMNREILPFSIQMADCLGNIPIFEAGPLDELSIYQRRIRVEEGFPRFEFFVYESADESHHGSWGCIDFQKPFDFTPQDRMIPVDPKFGFGRSIPLFRDIRNDGGQGLKRCFDRTMGWTDGRINFRDYAGSHNEHSQRLIRFFEGLLRDRFHSKVFLLEREFNPPPKRFDFIYQRYYLSCSQELMVVREWWAPGPDKTLVRRKLLYTCQGSKEANNILSIKWGYA
jgi:hypothetical protein